MRPEIKVYGGVRMRDRIEDRWEQKGWTDACNVDGACLDENHLEV